MRFDYYKRPLFILNILIVFFILIYTPYLLTPKNVVKDRLCGRVVSYPFKLSQKRQYLFVKSDKVKYLVFIGTSTYYALYDKVCIYGDVKRIESKKYFGSFDWQSYMNLKNIFYQIEPQKIDVIERIKFFELSLKIREFFIKNLSYFDRDTSSILKGLVLGIKEDLPKDIDEAINICGVKHLMVASGSNISYFVGFVYLLFSFFNIRKKLTSIIALFFGFIYVTIIGFDPPITRAYSMLLIGFLIHFLRRNVDSFQILCVVFFLIILINPLSIHDPSFVMSFLCVYGIVVGYMSWEKIISNKLYPKYVFWKGRFFLKFQIFLNKSFNSIKNIFFLTFFSQVMLFPYLITHFYKVSVVSFISNIFFIPLSSFIITLSMIYTVVRSIFGSLFFEYPCKLSVLIFVKLLYFFSSFKFSSLYISSFSNLHTFSLLLCSILIIHLPIINLKDIYMQLFIFFFAIILLISFLKKDVIKDDIFLKVSEAKGVSLILRNGYSYVIDPFLKPEKIINAIFASRRCRVDYILITSRSNYNKNTVKKLNHVFNVKNIYMPIWLCDRDFSNVRCVFGNEEGDGFYVRFRNELGYFDYNSSLKYCFGVECF